MQVDPLDVLWRGGVHYLQPRGPWSSDAAAPEPSRAEPRRDELVATFAALACSGDPRHAEAMVAALLRRPDWDGAATDAAAELAAMSAGRREILWAHTAAAYLGRHWQPLLRLYLGAGYTPVPDRFSAQLGLPPATDDPFGARWNVAVLAARRGAEDGADFMAEFDRVVHHLEGQLAAEGERVRGGPGAGGPGPGAGP